MPQAQTIEKAVLREIKWNEDGQVREVSDQKVTVQFNPQSLKLSYSNQKAGGNQPGGGAIQFVGKGTTKLSVELLFDVTVTEGEEGGADDVREVVEQVVRFIKPGKKEGDNKYYPPGLRFIWGSFLFEGVVDSINETLEFFSSDGRPLRATVSLAMSQQEIKPELANPDFQRGAAQAARTNPGGGAGGGSNGGGGGQRPPGTQPQEPARSGDSVQSMAARQGRPDNWQSVARANNIENPRNLSPGTLVDMSALSQVKAQAKAGISGSFQTSGSFGVGATGSAQAGLSGSAKASASASANAGASASASASASAKGSGNVSIRSSS